MRVPAPSGGAIDYLGDASGDGGGEEVGDADDVDELAEEDEEDGHGGAVRAGAQRPHGHQHAVPPVREREQLQERHLGRLLRLLLPAAAAALLGGAIRRRAHARVPGRAAPAVLDQAGDRGVEGSPTVPRCPRVRE